jgi:hypothetical protein
VQLIEEAADSMIKFCCENCGQKISVPEIHAGKKGKCPKCKSIVVVPTLKQIPAQKAEASVQPGKEDGVFEKRLEIPREPESKTQAEETEPSCRRTLPWIIDIFLYPTSTPGLIMLGIFVGVPLVIRIVLMLLTVPTLKFPPMLVLGLLIGTLGWIIKFIIVLYMYWYFCECIRDSAAGSLRAPETLANTPGLGDMFGQCLRILGCFIVFFAPMLIYDLYAGKTDTVFWALLGYAIFFFPMGLLAVVMFDSLRGLNPILLIGSIFSTFLQYCALVILYYGLAGLFRIIVSRLPQSLIPSFVLSAVSIYSMMILAHLLGRFYWRYQEKLNWEV